MVLYSNMTDSTEQMTDASQLGDLQMRSLRSVPSAENVVAAK